ncbi:ABC transporter ATP-binding protein [Lentibacillus amyloliquefaciens]|uniref:ABC transporter ATP-binding protein n=1 Tax=Lentibacillus amyloliquefaciens TaxID=1472767 RepID=A0A0U4FNE7_9BACI|nr:ABC transporter ATP-binding protein [Lentibacillus amyloliquefaciens]ALX49268.1 ABC transporter ATP-binding protein [Lentibacillus amyloliquefaciens]
MLTINNINKSYAGNHALSNVSLHIPEGICYGLVGPNGAGKSTLIKIIASVIHNFDGHVQFSNNKLQIGYVPQEISLEETVTAYDNLYFFGKLYGLYGKVLNRRANQVLSEIGLENRGKDKVLTFSGGMKRRLNIGCALMHKPRLIITDEPTVGIDPQSRQYIFQMIEQLKANGCTIIYASHYMEEIEQICDEAAFMDHGQIVENGPVESLLQKYAIPAVYVKGQHGLPDDIDQYGSVTSKDNGYLITTSNPLKVMEKLIDFSRMKDCRLERLELSKPSLEEVFFALTGTQLRD